MTYFPSITVGTNDRGSGDAFARLRTSNPYTLFDSKNLVDSGSIFWAQTASNGATIEYTQSRASLKLIVPATANARAIRQTKLRFNYQPGKSQLILSTFLMNAGATGIIKCTGYYDDNDGIFFEQSGTDTNFVLRSSASLLVVDTRISQSSWNIDTFTGNGPSGLTLDLTKAQIFFTDFEWLGVGRVRYGFYMNGKPYYAHEITHYNFLTAVYMSTPNLPLRYEIINPPGTNTGVFEQICSAVISEGGFEFGGIVRNADTGLTTVNIPTATYRPVISIRLASGKSSTSVLPTSIAIMNSDTKLTNSASLRWTVQLNPTFGGGALNWQNVSNSSVQYATASTTTTIATEGLELFTGFVSTADKNNTADFSSFFKLGMDITGSSDVFTLGAYAISGSSNVVASINWREST